MLEIMTYEKKNGNWTIYNPSTVIMDSLTYLNGLLTSRKRTDCLNRVTENTVFLNDSILGTFYQCKKKNYHGIVLIKNNSSCVTKH